ncbi:MAG TPA: hypothetical protein VF180_07145, partial [Acidimicrobiia bacterium]
EPVLGRLRELITAASPVTAELRGAAPDVQAAARGTRTIVEALPEDLSNLLDFVRNAALATAGHDGISHYLRIFSLGNSKGLGPAHPPGTNAAPTASAPVPTGGPLSGPLAVPSVPALIDQTPVAPLLPSIDLGSATGLTQLQEHSLLRYLLGTG